jgi:type III secretory pathway component EscS
MQRLFIALLIIAIGLALLPVVSDFVTELTGADGDFQTGPLASLIKLLPTLYVLMIVGGVVGYVVTGFRKS